MHILPLTLNLPWYSCTMLCNILFIVLGYNPESWNQVEQFYGIENSKKEQKQVLKSFNQSGKGCETVFFNL